MTFHENVNVYIVYKSIQLCLLTINNALVLVAVLSLSEFPHLSCSSPSSPCTDPCISRGLLLCSAR
jgi:hypothetical protein